VSRLKTGAVITVTLVALIGGFEGLRLAAYRDPVGIPTICFGETKGVKMGQKKTREECDAMLVESMREHEKGMLKCIKNPDALKDGAYGAFLSFTYNVGVGAFCKSTLAKKVNAGDVRGACNELMKWDKAKGIRLPGLTRRRAEERQLCMRGL
jgi:lysozyme